MRRDPSWNPAGTKIVFSVWVPANMSLEVFTVRASGGTPHQITDTPAIDEHQPVWSPNGSWIVASANNDKDPVFDCDLYRFRPDGSDRRRITDTPSRYESSPDWKADGSRISYTVHVDASSLTDVMTNTPDGSKPSNITKDVDLDVSNAIWLSNGRIRRMVVDLVFETHATTEDNEEGIATGWNPGRLSPAGREQARLLGGRRGDEELSAIFTSDLWRAVETVEIAFPGTTLPVLHDWRLRECNYGEMNGTLADELRRQDHLDVPYPSGESWRTAIDRVSRFLRDLEPWSGTRVLVIGHTATRYALDHLLDHVPIEDLLASPFSWQEGWEYQVGGREP